MIYISSSWKQRERVRKLANLLREAGFKVYDFTDPSCRETPEIPPEKFPEQFDPNLHKYADYINKPEWRAAVEENRRAIEKSEIVVLLLPCGADAHADYGYALGLGKRAVVVGHPDKGDRSPTHLWAEKILGTIEEAVRYLCQNRFCGPGLQE